MASIINVASATEQELVDKAAEILEEVRHDTGGVGTHYEYIEWLCAMIVRLHNDLHGVPHDTIEDEKKDIARWAKLTELLFGGVSK